VRAAGQQAGDYVATNLMSQSERELALWFASFWIPVEG
jgi:hypothetical protein